MASHPLLNRETFEPGEIRQAITSIGMRCFVQFAGSVV